jgi:hypothetical protein
MQVPVTKILKVYEYVLTDGTGERTSVGAQSQLGCRLNTIDPLDYMMVKSPTIWVVPVVEDRCCASYYGFSVHRNVIE